MQTAITLVYLSNFIGRNAGGFVSGTTLVKSSLLQTMGVLLPQGVGDKGAVCQKC